MIGINSPAASNHVRLGGTAKGPPNDRFAGPIDWQCAKCGTVLVAGVSEQYAEHALPCFACGQWNRTPYPDEKN